jgi:hypothetical protein
MIKNLVPSTFLAPFKSTMGVHFDKVCNDIGANIGRIEKDVVTKHGDWTCGTKGKLQSKDGHVLQLPLNAPWTVLVRFGLQLTAIAKNGSSDEPAYTMTIDADIPAEAKSWYETNYQHVAKQEKQVA